MALWVAKVADPCPSSKEEWVLVNWVVGTNAGFGDKNRRKIRDNAKKILQQKSRCRFRLVHFPEANPWKSWCCKMWDHLLLVTWPGRSAGTRKACLITDVPLFSCQTNPCWRFCRGSKGMLNHRHREILWSSSFRMWCQKHSEQACVISTVSMCLQLQNWKL